MRIPQPDYWAGRGSRRLGVKEARHTNVYGRQPIVFITKHTAFISAQVPVLC